MRSLIEALRGGNVLISDGAWGTELYGKGLQPGECPELWNVSHRAEVLAVAKSYVDAGADMILTNSFGGNPSRLASFGAEGRAAELNEAAAAISREAAGDDHFVLGSVGPTGLVIMLGQISDDEAYDGFRVQAAALKKGGVDVICVETMSAIDEACLAVRAAKEATGLEIICTFTFEQSAQGGFRTMMGVSPAEMVRAVTQAGADIVGTNCGNGFGPMVGIVREIRAIDASIPVLVHANAGKPVFRDGATVYPEGPEEMADRLQALVRSGANIIGGCCGTTPLHIQALAKARRNAS